MKMPKHSISYKIWLTMMTTTGLFLLIVAVINVTVLESYKKEIYYDQLEDAAQVKAKSSDISKKADSPKTNSSSQNNINTKDKTHIDLDDDLKDDSDFELLDETVLIAHFLLVNDNNKVSFEIDSFTRALYPGDSGLSLVHVMSNHIMEDDKDHIKGAVEIDDSDYLYYVQWIEPNKRALVYFTPEIHSGRNILPIFMIFIGIMFISFITSKLVASNIAKPIKELEVFAEEVAKRNWNASLPEYKPDEIGLLANSLKDMSSSLRIAEERDREFLQSTSHDLKTPVMIIKGYAQALLDGVEINSETSVANVIKTESERLERRINQLLQLNTISHTLENNDNRDIVRVDRIIKSLVSRCSVVTTNIKWNVNLTPLEINGNSETLLIAFENLFDNNIRFASSTININMTTENNINIITISNDGPSFTIENPQELFDSYKKDSEGKFGLGLSIVDKVIKSHKGNIVAFNTDDGVAFQIVF